MSDLSGAPMRPRDTSSAVAAFEVDLDVVLALSRATARTVKAVSPEAAELFRVFLQREIDRLKLAGDGSPNLAIVRLREFFRD